MAKLYVEGWAPEFGAPFEPDEQLAPAEGAVDTAVETEDWSPIDGVDDGVQGVAFVDGVRRIDARLTLDDPEHGPVPGICGTYAVGATLWRRDDRRSDFGPARIRRMAILSAGRGERFPAVDLDPAYDTEPIPSPDPDDLVRHLHTHMRKAEGEHATALARDGWFVVADGPLNDLSPQTTVGHVKSHRVTYLPPERNSIVAALAAGQRTPMFTIAAFQRYSWYVRLAEMPGGHSWSGVVRCEASGQLPREEVRTIADRTAAMLPRVASEAHLDPRAPQNLVPVAALERQLKHLMGDRGLVFRAIRTAVAREETMPA
jgi:hypothetical protein